MFSLEKCLLRFSTFFFLLIGFAFLCVCVCCMSYLYIFQVNPLPGASFASFFFSPILRVSFLCTLSFFFFFSVQKFLSLIRPHLLTFFFIFITLGGRSQKILLQFMSKRFLPVFL